MNKLQKRLKSLLTCIAEILLYFTNQGNDNGCQEEQNYGLMI